MQTVSGHGLGGARGGHPNAPGYEPEAKAPHNLEAEQALLGVILYENNALLEVDGLVSERDFFEPFHARLYRSLEKTIRAGRVADPIVISSFFAIDPAYEELGGLRYLADLVDRAPPFRNARAYAEAVRSVALRRDVIKICADISRRAVEEDETDGSALMGDLESQVLNVRTSKMDLVLRDFSDVADEVVDGMNKPDERPLIKVGMQRVDKAVGGFERGDLVVLGGRPGMGKSALAGCWALSVAMSHKLKITERPQGVIELNGEMTTVQMTRRHLTDRAFTLFGDKGPYYRDIRRKQLTEGQQEVLHRTRNDLHGIPLKMLKRTGMSLGRMRAAIRRQKMLWDAQGIDLAMVVVDHVGLVVPDDQRSSGNRTQDQTMISGGLKEMAGELDVVMVALAQLSRKVEDRDDKRPGLSDLRDSGSWEQDADVVIGTYRDAYYARREREPKGDLKVAEWMARCASQEVEAIILKLREGEVATAKLWADIGRNAIRDERPVDDLFTM